MTVPRVATHDLRRRFRLSLAGALAALLLVVSVGPVGAWSNGYEGNGYGTHDWIIDQAVNVLDGRADGWFDAQAARLASDDPDYLERMLDPTRDLEHVYREAGKYGGAIQRITEHYASAVTLYAAGAEARKAGDTATAGARFTEASVQLGLLSHFIGDISQPYHSAYPGVTWFDEHKGYEALVDDRTGSAGESAAWSSARRTVNTVTNVRATAVATAAYSRARWSALHAALHRNGGRMDATVSRITGEVLKRATNDLADIIWSVSKGTGIAPAVGSISLSMRWQGTRQGETNQAIFATVRDVSGHPVPGIQVDVAWPLPNGGTTPVRFWTNTAGKGAIPGSVGASPLMLKRVVTASTTTNGVTVSRSTWYYATRRLAAGSAGFRTKVSDTTVVPGQRVTVRTYAGDAGGRPMAGLRIVWTWNYNGTKVRTTGYTGADGRATSSRVITARTTRKSIRVTASTQASNARRSSSASFHRIR